MHFLQLATPPQLLASLRPVIFLHSSLPSLSHLILPPICLSPPSLPVFAVQPFKSLCPPRRSVQLVTLLPPSSQSFSSLSHMFQSVASLHPATLSSLFFGSVTFLSPFSCFSLSFSSLSHPIQPITFLLSSHHPVSYCPPPPSTQALSSLPHSLQSVTFSLFPVSPFPSFIQSVTFFASSHQSLSSLHLFPSFHPVIFLFPSSQSPSSSPYSTQSHTSFHLGSHIPPFPSSLTCFPPVIQSAIFSLHSFSQSVVFLRVASYFLLNF